MAGWTPFVKVRVCLCLSILSICNILRAVEAQQARR